MKQPPRYSRRVVWALPRQAVERQRRRVRVASGAQRRDPSLEAYFLAAVLVRQPSGHAARDTPTAAGLSRATWPCNVDQP